MLLAQVLHASSERPKIIGWIVIVGLAAYVVRVVLWSVTAGTDGVRICGLVRTHVLSWSEIDHFSLGRLGLFPAVGIAHRTRGRPLAMSAIEVARMSTVKGRADAQAMITELNRLLAEHGGGDGSRAETRTTARMEQGS